MTKPFFFQLTPNQLREYRRMRLRSQVLRILDLELSRKELALALGVSTARVGQIISSKKHRDVFDARELHGCEDLHGVGCTVDRGQLPYPNRTVESGRFTK